MLGGDQSAPLRSAQVGGLTPSHDPEPHLPDGLRHRREAQLPDQPEVDATWVGDVEAYEEVLSNGLGSGEDAAVQACGLLRESSLRGADAHIAFGEVPLEDGCETVDDVSFRHCPIPADRGCRRR